MTTIHHKLLVNTQGRGSYDLTAELTDFVNNKNCSDGDDACEHTDEGPDDMSAPNGARAPDLSVTRRSRPMT